MLVSSSALVRWRGPVESWALAGLAARRASLGAWEESRFFLDIFSLSSSSVRHETPDNNRY